MCPPSIFRFRNEAVQGGRSGDADADAIGNSSPRTPFLAASQAPANRAPLNPRSGVNDQPTTMNFDQDPDENLKLSLPEVAGPRSAKEIFVQYCMFFIRFGRKFNRRCSKKAAIKRDIPITTVPFPSKRAREIHSTLWNGLVLVKQSSV